MAELLVADYSFTRPDRDALKAAGFIGVMRYGAYRNPSTAQKIIDQAELDELHAAGLYVGFVWETTVARMTQGAEAGRLDGIEFNRLLASLGVPLSLPVYYALDEDPHLTDVATCDEYLTAAGQQGRKARFYGGVSFGDQMVASGEVDTYWQTEAWSGGKVSSVAALYQRVATTLPGVDENLVLRADWGGWLPGAPEPTPPTPTQPVHKETKMVSLMRGSAPDVYLASDEAATHVRAGQVAAKVYAATIRGNYYEPPADASVVTVEGHRVWIVADDFLAPLVVGSK